MGASDAGSLTDYGPILPAPATSAFCAAPIPGPSISAVVRASRSTTSAARLTKKLFILDSVDATAPTWTLIQASRRGVTTAAGPVCAPDGLLPCSLAEDPADPSALTYFTMFDVYNSYEVLTDTAHDDTQPPDVDIAAYDEHGNASAGFTEDTPLVSRRAARALMGTRQLNPKRQQLSPQ
ncbi:unnamed protein product [Peronospora belbahrii]|uniref:Uncharacterized protein n=1 Tax=Peronospora belbahrii TaxID=622444 RepID=A0AAU9KNA1_9STRA|nr:unnamed protein product [Peronospora belbahrii]